MRFKYQLILLGVHTSLTDQTLSVFYQHVNELGLGKEYFTIITPTSFKSYKSNLPTFCLYFGNQSEETFPDIDILQRLIKDSTFILPVVSNLAKFKNEIPEELANINAFELQSSTNVEALVSCILEGLSLLRLTRRIFISYKRDESTSVAIQLYESLEKHGFDVFLDTHSIRPGEPFQDELWHRMADTDVVILLNTPNFLESKWTKQELQQANSMSIGLFQLVWPNHRSAAHAQLCDSLVLNENNFEKLEYKNSKTSYLTTQTLDSIVMNVESSRARNLASRQDNIIAEFMSASWRFGKVSQLHPEKFITVKRSDSKESILIPTVGVPEAFTYHQSAELFKRIKSKNIEGVYLLFDHRNIRRKWLEHLHWLDQYLPVQTIKIVEVERWLEKI